MPNRNLQSSLESRSQKLEDHLRILTEEGLFRVGDSTAAEGVAKAIEDARRSNAEEAARTLTLLTQAERELLQATYERGWLWRLVHVHHVPMFVYFLVSLIVLIALMLSVLAASYTSLTDWVLCSPSVSPLEIFGVPVSILALGALGAVLRGLWWLHYKVSIREYRPHFMTANLCAPFVGALLGLLSYLLFKAGVLSLGGGASDLNLPSAVLPQAFAFLAGFSWEWLVELVNRILSQNTQIP